MVCVRRAWLDLTGDGTITLPLEDLAAGYVCAELDLAYPTVREVANNRPSNTGTDDRTTYLAERAVAANIAVRTAAQPDVVPALFAPFMLPAARPVLHYVLDRPGAPERILTLRAAGATWPISGKVARDLQFQWVAPDPVARDPAVRVATAWRGASVSPGRVYPLRFNRVYPPGGGSPSSGVIHVAGDFPARPLLRFYGPVTSPACQIYRDGVIPYLVVFRTGYVINAGDWVDVDTDQKTVYVNSDPNRPDHSAIDWTTTSWPSIPNDGAYWVMVMGGQTTTGVTQVQAIWQDGYLL